MTIAEGRLSIVDSKAPVELLWPDQAGWEEWAERGPRGWENDPDYGPMHSDSCEMLRGTRCSCSCGLSLAESMARLMGVVNEEGIESAAVMSALRQEVERLREGGL